jgi:hypothetical protein
VKQKLLWRHRKRSEADPIQTLDCGCKVWCYDGTVIKPCQKHNRKVKREIAEKQLATWNNTFEEILEVKK